MLTGEIRSQIDQVWNAFWSRHRQPARVIEQITYLLFLKRLDEQEIAEELKANREKKPMQKRFSPAGKDNKKRSFQDYRWNCFKNTDPRDMYTVVSLRLLLLRVLIVTPGESDIEPRNCPRIYSRGRAFLTRTK
jgi:type I restriction enzyme M protein